MAAGRFYDRLVQRLGKRHIFKDVDNIYGGADFINAINEALRRSDVVIVMIGHKWLTLTDPEGGRRLDNPNDFVRYEVETALKRDVLVLPVLVDNALMPSKHDLPLPLRDLSDRNALPLRADPDFKKDADRIINHIKRYQRRHLLRYVMMVLIALMSIALAVLAAAQVGWIGDERGNDDEEPVAEVISSAGLTGTTAAQAQDLQDTQTAIAETITALAEESEEAQNFALTQTAVHLNNQTATAEASAAADSADDTGYYYSYRQPCSDILANAPIELVSLPARQEALPTWYAAVSNQLYTLDPQVAVDPQSFDAIEQLFLGLTDHDPEHPGEMRPELATSWSVSEDGLTWTFTLRDDVPWVRWDPFDREAEVLRMVTADDVAFGIQRACDPNIDVNYYSQQEVSRLIRGCDDLLDQTPERVSYADYDLVKVYALDDTTLQIELNNPTSYFLAMTAMPSMRPVRRETIEEYDDEWIEVGKIVTNGPFVLHELELGVRRVFLRNPYIPRDLLGPINFERVIDTVVEDTETRYALFLDNQIASVEVPAAELQSVLADPFFGENLVLVSDSTAFYLAFAHDKPPFDDVRVRRAFSAAVDRNAFVEEVRHGFGIPMNHFTPPRLFGAPPINEVGMGYDPEFARTQLEAAGYQDCEGFPTIEMFTFPRTRDWAEYLAFSIEYELGCDPNTIDITQMDYSALLEAIDTDHPPGDRPHMWTMHWRPAYADANALMSEAINCRSKNYLNRPCTDADDLIDRARIETDADDREAMYYQIEDMLFGRSGEFPFIPLYLDLNYVLHQPYADAWFETDGIFGGEHYDWRCIDHYAQERARVE
jgi:oligopeptide transport system substrate-binding protein